MELFFTFLVTVTAGVVCHLISKWLDRHDKGNKQPGGCFATIKRKEESLDCTLLRSGDSFFAYMEFPTFLCLLALQHMQILIAKYISFSQDKNLSLSGIYQCSLFETVFLCTHTFQPQSLYRQLLPDILLVCRSRHSKGRYRWNNKKYGRGQRLQCPIFWW